MVATLVVASVRPVAVRRGRSSQQLPNFFLEYVALPHPELGVLGEPNPGKRRHDNVVIVQNGGIAVKSVPS